MLKLHHQDMLQYWQYKPTPSLAIIDNSAFGQVHAPEYDQVM